MGQIILGSGQQIQFNIPADAGYGVDEIMMIWFYTNNKDLIKTEYWNLVFKTSEFQSLADDWLVKLVPIFIYNLIDTVNFELKDPLSELKNIKKKLLENYVIGIIVHMNMILAVYFVNLIYSHMKTN